MASHDATTLTDWMPCAADRSGCLNVRPDLWADYFSDFAVSEGRCWMAMRISSGSVRTPSLVLIWVQVLATVL